MKGIALIEIIVGVAIIASSFLMLGNIAQLAMRLTDIGTERMQAVFLAGEGLEAVRTMRDRDWDLEIAPLGAGTTYYLAFDGSANEWHATTTVQTVDSVFVRSFTVGEVRRDANDDIVSSGGTVDPGARRIAATVSWNNRGRAQSETLSTYITNLFNN